MKKKFKQNFDKVQSIINDIDPSRLIYSGAPNDEYDFLTTQLLGSIYNGKTRTDIKELILSEIEKHIGTPDLEILTEPDKTKFNNDIEKLIDKLEQEIKRKPSH